MGLRGKKSKAERELIAKIESGEVKVATEPPEAFAPLAPGAIEKLDPLEYLLAVMRGQTQGTADQLRAAIAAAQYTNRKLHDGGTKDAKQKKADDLAADPVSKFGVSNQPKRTANH